MVKYTYLGLICVALILPFHVVAEITDDDKKTIQDICGDSPPPPSFFFPEMRARALDVWTTWCALEYETSRVQVDEILAVLYAGAEEFGVSLKPTINELAALIDRQTNLAVGVPSLGNKRLGAPGYLLGDEEFTVTDLEECERVAKSHSHQTTCDEYFENFASIFNFVQGTFSRALAASASQHLDHLSQEWREYSETSRSQTLLEHAINGLIFRAGNTHHQFEGPPSRQLIILHPSVALEYVDNSPDGNEVEESLVIEIAGMNWWRQDAWYIPSGGSLISTYSDRAGIDDWGYGLALHFKNDLTIGYSDHNGAGAIFLSMDLWDLFENKRKKIRALRGTLSQKQQ